MWTYEGAGEGEEGEEGERPGNDTGGVAGVQ